MDQQFAVMEGRNGNPSIEFDGRRHDETIVVVRMFSDQFDASRSTVDPRPGAKELMEWNCCRKSAALVSPTLLYPSQRMRIQRVERWSARWPNVIMIKPKPSITKPHQKLTLIPSDA
jgi:hypothetical protein